MGASNQGLWLRVYRVCHDMALKQTKDGYATESC